MQLIWSRNHHLRDFGSHFLFVLGTWHPYKVSCEHIFAAYFEDVFIDLLLLLNPDDSIRRTYRLSQISSMFIHLLDAYPRVSDQLQNAIDTMNILNTNRSSLLHLRDLFELYIPTVSVLFVCVCIF